jgi:hypothetical protein
VPYLVEQKIGDKIYVYQATGYWDSKKRQSRQKRVYIGIKDPATGEIHAPRKEHWQKTLSFDYGVIHAANHIAQENQLTRLLDEVFASGDSRQILALAVYAATQNAPLYLFENWARSTWGLDSFSMSSQDISAFLAKLGKNERGRATFWKKWAGCHGKSRNFIFDITSISTCSATREFAEYGHNRDGEALPQINVGMLFSEQLNAPLGYRVYPGSIGDVSTLKNLLLYMREELGIDYARMILDRGFYSLANLKALDKAGYDFIIPLPSGLKTVKELLLATRRDFDDASRYFLFNGRLLGHKASKVMHAGKTRDVHVFLDLTRRNDELDYLHKKLARIDDELESRAPNEAFAAMDEAKSFIEAIASGMSSLYSIQKVDGGIQVARNNPAIDRHAGKFGKFVLLPSQQGMGRLELLTDYYRRDVVEKFFDVLKNEMDFHRGRVRKQAAFEARLFIHIIGLILYGEMRGRLSRGELGDKITYPEMISHLQRLKRVSSLEGQSSLNELTKRQRDIFTALRVPLPAN